VAGVDRALKDTVQKYSDRTGMKVDLKRVQKQIRHKPFPQRQSPPRRDSLSAANWSRGLAWR
jgi:hypothetical protein